MKTTYDKVANAMYIYLSKSKNSKVKKTIEIKDNVLIDIGKDNDLLGVETFSASKYLHKSELKNIEKLIA